MCSFEVDHDFTIYVIELFEISTFKLKFDCFLVYLKGLCSRLRQRYFHPHRKPWRKTKPWCLGGSLHGNKLGSWGVKTFYSKVLKLSSSIRSSELLCLFHTYVMKDGWAQELFVHSSAKKAYLQLRPTVRNFCCLCVRTVKLKRKYILKWACRQQSRCSFTSQKRSQWGERLARRSWIPSNK